MRNSTSILAIVFLVMMTAAGCESMGSGAKKGSIGGALAGAAAGGIIGHQSGHGWEGALIGGAGGALLGGVVGNEFDKRQLAINAQHIPLQKIAEMGAQGVPGDAIIAEIKRTQSKYELTSEIISYLRENGITDKVIDHMMGTAQG